MKTATKKPQSNPTPNTSSGLSGWAIAGAVVCAVAGLALLFIAVTNKPDEDMHFAFINAFILCGLAAGLFVAAKDYIKIGRTSEVTFSWKFTGIVAAIGIVISALIYWCGMRQIGGYDHSILIDVGWRLISGQKPHVDFPCTLPVAFFLGSKFAYMAFGLAWSSLIKIMAIYAFVTFLWLTLLLRQLFGNERLAILLSGTFHAMSLIDVSFWWYNPITAMAAVIFLFSAVLWYREQQSKGAAACYTCALFLMAMMKVNVAGILVPVVSVILFITRLRWRVLVCSAIAFAAFMVVLALNHVHLDKMLQGYLSVADRGFSLKQFLQDMGPNEKKLSLLALAMILIPALGGLFRIARVGRNAKTWIGIIGLLAGGYGFVTDGESKIVDLPAVLAAALILAAYFACDHKQPAQEHLTFSPAWHRYSMFLCIVLLFAGLGQAIARHRVRAIGPFFEYGGTTEVVTDGFFKGVHGGPRFIEMNRELTEILHNEGNATIMFGPRIVWANAAYRRQSATNMPMWWEAGVAYGRKEEPTYVQRFIDQPVDTIILYEKDVANLPFDLIQYIVQNYTADFSHPMFTVLHRVKR